MTDNRTNEPTEAQIQRATIEYREHFFRRSDGTTRICVCGVTTEGLAEFSEHRMRAALVAAQGAAPQAAKDIHEPNHDRVYCVRCGGNWPCQPTPVLPSSGVDEEKLAEVERAAAARALEAAARDAQGAAPRDNGKCGGCRDLGPHRNVPGCQYYEAPAPPSSGVDETREEK